VTEPFDVVKPGASYGGNTTWASTEAACEQSPARLRALTENLWAVHTNHYDYAADYDGRHEDLVDTVRLHPETGKHVLLRGLRQTVCRVGPNRVGDAIRSAASSDHKAGEHYSLDVAGGRS
jgi:alpha-ketoglutarate-dependent taurine dioxygenase